MTPQPEKLIDKWRFYCKDLVSPDTFIDYGLYFMVSAALQRRIWTGPADFAIFPNLYILLVGPPGVGKGLIIGQVNDYLRYWKKRAQGGMTEEQAKLVEKAQMELENFKLVMAEHGVTMDKTTAKTNYKEDPLLFPLAADSTTYESLMEESGKCSRSYTLPKGEVHPAMAPKGTYVHNSLAFCLEELSSLFRIKTADIGKYLLNAYDCKYYKYKTKHQGEDAIAKPCMNLIAGTTPGFLEEGTSAKLIADGLFSRFIMVYEPENRFERFKISELSTEQIEARTYILNRLKSLSTKFGQMTYTEEAEAFFTEYFEKRYKKERINRNPKLDTYYVRKKVNAIKLAMSVHFADKDDMVLDIEDCQTALAILHKIEPKMHYALTFSGKNPLAAVQNHILRYMTMIGKPLTFREIWNEFAEDAREGDLLEMLKFLGDTGKIRTDTVGGVQVYLINKQEPPTTA